MLGNLAVASHRLKPGPGNVELRVGMAPATWNQAEWETSSDRVAVPAGPWPPAPPPKAPRLRKLAKPTATGKAAKKARRATAAAKAADQALLVRTVDVDPAKYADKTVVIDRVRVHGPSGNDDGWSRLISLEVKAALAAPRERTKATNARDAVHLQWAANAPEFEFFERRLLTRIGSKLARARRLHLTIRRWNTGKCSSIGWNRCGRRGISGRRAIFGSDFMDAEKDEFPPAVPAGLVAISGTRSVELSWDRVADSDLAGYRVYRNGVKVAEGLQVNSCSDRMLWWG